MAARMINNSPLAALIASQNRGESKGITSICSANPWVIEATLQHAQKTGEPVLIESTCNQVNQFGGYTGWTPAEFVTFLRSLSERQGFSFDQLLIGGDHLGPSPWQGEPVAKAMDKAKTLVQDCVRAGYTKIHLDASMKCADDDPLRPLETELSAERAAELALAAERTFSDYPTGVVPPYYVIGTEVPLPGGAQDQEEVLPVSSTSDVADTIELTKQAFLKRGLELAWQRVIAVVVQPGVEYGDVSLFEYDRSQAATLARFIEGHDGLVYEAHSTDYQPAKALRQLVEDHFAILKVGPALTFAFREGVYALATIEEELLDGQRDIELSRVREVLDEAMLANSIYWQKYYHGDALALRLARQYSFSDRSRYYWPVPEVQRALSRLLINLGELPLPLTLLSQHLPMQYNRCRKENLVATPQAILHDKIKQVLASYSFACGYLSTP